MLYLCTSMWLLYRLCIVWYSPVYDNMDLCEMPPCVHSIRTALPTRQTKSSFVWMSEGGQEAFLFDDDRTIQHFFLSYIEAWSDELTSVAAVQLLRVCCVQQYLTRKKLFLRAAASIPYGSKTINTTYQTTPNDHDKHSLSLQHVLYSTHNIRRLRTFGPVAVTCVRNLRS